MKSFKYPRVNYTSEPGILLNMGDGQHIIHVTHNKWEVQETSEAPVIPYHKTLPDPVAPEFGNLDKIFDYIHTDDKNLVKQLFIEAFRPSIPHHIWVLQGPVGCGKTVAASMLTAFFDPFISFTSSSMNHTINVTWFPVYENVSTLTNLQQDLLTQVISMGAVKYTHPVMLLACQDNIISHADLAARTRIIHLNQHPILSGSELKGLYTRFYARDRYIIFSGILNALAATI
jgi:hypothetical protein